MKDIISAHWMIVGMAIGCMVAPAAVAQSAATLIRGPLQATMSVTRDGGLRTYELASNAPLRDNRPADQRITFAETADRPYLRTGDLMFDGLYAMAVHEALQNSVPEIKDSAYGNGDPFRIDAFQTGEKWTYVWTRDLAYSVNLSLGAFDPQRSVGSLLFKTSRTKPSVSGGFRHQIIQDTGSGGSYPVSTDRVVWALGAWETLKYLSGSQREAFLGKVYPILHDTIEQDRLLVYDPRDGLYRGEQSFLDWREQTYPEWTKDNVLPIALSKSLSVNVLNVYLLTVASECAGHVGRPDEAERYACWAQELKTAINGNFYDPGADTYSAYLLSDGHCNVRAKRYDLLGESLAILFGVADRQRAVAVLSGYPVGPHGPPVVWPQERSVPIYHNQAIWPFVTAYWIKAARMQDHYQAVSHGIRTMMQQAAFNLSNMENYDVVSGQAEVKDQPLSGPVINSRRQLWSVAGYLSMVQDVVFGLQTSWDGIRFRPCMTAALRDELFASSDRIELRNFSYCGTRNQVRIHLPPVDALADGAYQIGSMMLNGRAVGDGFVPLGELKAENRWDIVLQVPETVAVELPMHWMDVDDPHLLYAPAPPVWDMDRGGITVEDGRLQLQFSHGDPEHVLFNIYRDGVLAAHEIAGTVWVDEASSDYAAVNRCYAVEAVDPVSGNASHLTPLLCRRGGEHSHVVPAKAMKNRGGTLVADDHFEEWGEPADELLAKTIAVQADGSYALRARFSNGSGPVNTGITCAVKRLDLIEEDSGKVAASGYLIMPQSGDWTRWDWSSPVMASLQAGKTYRLRIFEDDKARNMSYLEANERYTAWPGGGKDSYNFVNIAAVQLDLVSAGAPEPRLTRRGESE